MSRRMASPPILGTCDASVGSAAAMSRRPRWRFSARIAACKQKRRDHEHSCSVGLGYVGLPLAVAFGKKCGPSDSTSAPRSGSYRRQSIRWERSPARSSAATRLTLRPIRHSLPPADIIVVAVPTPVDTVRRPDFRPLVWCEHHGWKTHEKRRIVVYNPPSTRVPPRKSASGPGEESG